VLVLGVVLFLVNVVVSLRGPRDAGDNPWDAPTLEWATTSPPANYNFALTPVVEGRTPLWEDREGLKVVTGLAASHREVLLTTPMEARPDLRHVLPRSTYWPFVAAVATSVLFIGSVFDEKAVLWASPLVAASLIGWFWPKPDDKGPRG
jgi:cytochrome c oxidase subunit I+III